MVEQQANATLTDQDTLRIEKLKTEQLREEVRASLRLRRLMIAELTGVSLRSVKLGHAESGAPILVLPRGWSMSVSQKDDLTAIALAPAPAAIGIDIERIRPIDWRPMLTMLCADEERGAFLAMHPELDTGLRAFLRLWTVKEAIMKATGEGFRSGPKKIVVAAGKTLNEASIVSCPGNQFETWTEIAGDMVISLARQID
jgi:4'-phosphopantetheinyl transferase